MKVIGITFIISSVAILLWHFSGEVLAADMCLDAGQVYDYATSQCRADVNHLPYIPYAKNFSWVITGSLVAFLLGIAGVVFSKRRKSESSF